MSIAIRLSRTAVKVASESVPFAIVAGREAVAGGNRDPPFFQITPE